MSIDNFTIRVYALIRNESDEILLSDEYRFKQFMTKFPGGGLEYGEGLKDCLKREITEELNTELIIQEHFYTTDFFQQALFFEKTQLISVYYLCQIPRMSKLKLHQKSTDLNQIEGEQAFRWVKIKDMNEDEISFPIDKKVVKMLKEKYL